jgi:hypothetical protein
MHVMVMKTITRRFAAWIACCAMLFAALAPSVSHAMAAGRGQLWTEVCSAAGIKLVQADSASSAIDGHGDADTLASAHLEHCPFCAIHPVDLGLLPGSAWSMPLLAGRDTYPPLFFQSPHRLAAWTPAQSRAPPSC